MSNSRSELKRLKTLSSEAHRKRLEVMKASVVRRLHLAREDNDAQLVEALEREQVYLDKQ